MPSSLPPPQLSKKKILLQFLGFCVDHPCNFNFGLYIIFPCFDLRRPFNSSGWWGLRCCDSDVMFLKDTCHPHNKLCMNSYSWEMHPLLQSLFRMYQFWWIHMILRLMPFLHWQLFWCKREELNLSLHNVIHKRATFPFLDIPPLTINLWY